MSLVKLDIDFNQEEIRKYIHEKLDEQMHRTLFLMDVNEMARLTCMSKTFLEEEILSDPRMKLLERQKKHGKRFYFYEESIKVIREILDSWD